MRIAILKPTNIADNNSFGTSQGPVYSYISEKYGVSFDFFVDAKNTYKPPNSGGVKVIRVKQDKLLTFFTKILRKVLHPIPYPFFPTLMNFRGNYDLVLTESVSYSLVYYAFRWAHLFGSKVIINDSLTHRWSLQPWKLWFLSKAISQKTSFIFVNPFVKDNYMRNGLLKKNSKNEIEYIGHAVDLQLFKPQKDKQANQRLRLISVGRIVPEKGFQVIITALNKLIVKGYDLELIIVGKSSEYKQELIGKIQEYNLTNRVTFVDSCNHQEMPAHLSGADIFVSHPLDASHHIEPFHLANLEAMASGLPVITSDCGGVPYAVKDAALIVPQLDVEKLCLEIERMCDDPVYRKSYVEKGLSLVKQNYSIEAIGAAYYSFFKKVSETK